MRTLLVILAAVALVHSVPQPRKLFHEHVEDFMEAAYADITNDLQKLTEEYSEYELFNQALDYVGSPEFKDIIYEMENLPEFKAVLDFLEKDNIDIYYFIDLINSSFDRVEASERQARASGNTLTDYFYDLIELLPKEKLNALFEETLANDEEFKSAIENLYSEEWQQLYADLWAAEQFQQEVETLRGHGFDLEVVFLQIKALFGQN